MEHGSYYSYKKGCKCSDCKLANSKYVKQWSERNRQKVKQSNKIANKKYRENNRESISERHKKWRENNKEKVKKSSVISQAKRRAAKKKYANSFTYDQFNSMKNKYGNRCLRCGVHETYVGGLTVDHVIPLSWEESSNSIKNIQPLCARCNSIKGNRNKNDYRI